MREDEKAGAFDLKANLETNQLIEFELIAGQYEGKYTTKIEEVREKREFVIEAPFFQGKAVTVPVNSRGKVRLRTEGGIYSLPVLVIGRDLDVTPLLILKLSGKVAKVQERQFFRLKQSQETRFRIIASSREQFEKMVGIGDAGLAEPKMRFQNKKETSNFDKKGILKNISAGGVRLATQEEVKKGQIVQMDFGFMDISFDTLFGEIMRLDREVRDDIKRYLAGIRFLDAEDREQDELISWLFKKQCEWRRKGLI